MCVCRVVADRVVGREAGGRGCGGVRFASVYLILFYKRLNRSGYI